MRKYIFIMFAIMIATGVAIVPKEIMSNNSSSVLLSNIEAFAATSPEQFNGLNLSQDTCVSRNYIWGAKLGADNSGAETIRCNIDGELDLGVVKFSGPFGLGKMYEYRWAYWDCEEFATQCCDPFQADLYSEIVPL